jgi:hypothetical protein
MMDTLFDTKPKDIEIYADTVKYNACRGRGCGKMLTWAVVVKSGAHMCFTGKIEANGALKVATSAGGRPTWTLPLERNHWKDCPDRDRFRKKR